LTPLSFRKDALEWSSRTSEVSETSGFFRPNQGRTFLSVRLRGRTGNSGAPVPLESATSTSAAGPSFPVRVSAPPVHRERHQGHRLDARTRAQLALQAL